MVAMCRALMAKPKVLLMDEPSMGLAPVLVEQVFEIIKQIRALGTTIFVVEQNANMALSIADRGYVIQTGEVVLADTAPEPAGQPADARGLPGRAVMQLLDADELRRRLSMAAAIDALEAGFRSQDPVGQPAAVAPRDAGRLAAADARVRRRRCGREARDAHAGQPANEGCRSSAPSTCCSTPTTQTPEAILDGAALTALRTAAVSGLATRHLANPDAERLVIFGAGVQARSHLEAMLAVRPIGHVAVVSRTLERARALVDEARDRGVSADVGDVGDVADADVVCTCTTSDEPLFEGGRLAAGAHVNAVGSYLPASRELDTTAVLRARVVVETREAALAEAGELAIPIGEGAFGPEHVVADLAEVVRGARVRTARRTSPSSSRSGWRSRT